MLPFRD